MSSRIAVEAHSVANEGLERLASSGSEADVEAADLEAALPPDFEHRIHSNGAPQLTNIHIANL